MQTVGVKQNKLMRTIGHKYSRPMHVTGYRNNSNPIQTMPQPTNVADTNQVNSSPSLTEVTYMPMGLKQMHKRNSYNSLERKRG
jgi:hypothetical protein